MTRVINIDDLLLADRNLLYQGRLKGYVYIGRSSRASLNKWGNKYVYPKSTLPNTVLVHSREEAVARHRVDTIADPALMERIRRELKDKTLVCFCKPLACHGDTLADIADGGV